MPYTVPDHAADPESAAAWSFTLPRWTGPAASRPPCGASPRRQFQHPIVDRVGDVEVAGGIHRHTIGLKEAGE
jgi:hypothetical protein